MNIGDRFGRLVLLSIEATTRTHSQRYGRVRCDCGTEKDVRLSNLKNGATQSCGCLQAIVVKNAMYDRWETDKRNDRVGQRQGKLVVIKRDYSANKANKDNIYWVCRCDCGRQLSVPSHKLNGQTQSCRACYVVQCKS